MLAKIANHVCVFAAFDFDLTSLGRMHHAVDFILDRISTKSIAASPVQCFLRLKEGHCEISVGLKRLSWELLDLPQWKNHLSEYVDISNIAVEKLGVKQFDRMGFKVMAFIPLSMTHAEMSRLMFGSFLPELDELTPFLGQIDDPLVQFHGKRANLDYVLILSALTKANLTNAFRQIPNLGHFQDDQYLDDSLRKFHDRISAQDSLYFDVDFYQTDAPSQRLSEFLSSSLSEAESLANACVNHLQAKPSRK